MIRSNVSKICVVGLAVLQRSVTGWSSGFRNHHRNGNSHSMRFSAVSDNHESPNADLAGSKFFFSSWTDGMQHNPQALECLRQGLIQSARKLTLQQAEERVAESARFSTCCGPTDMDALQTLLEPAANNDIPVLRFLYIPTALYALRADSSNTPGKQRQRARADGKKRRTLVRNALAQLFPETTVATLTLDLDDGSIKQPQDCDNVPKNGREALQSWKPHLVYLEGGNTFWLRHCMEDWMDDLHKACDTAVYCGKSAGAIVAGALVETATWKGWDDPSIVAERPTYEDWKGVKGLDMADGLSFFPHMDDSWETLVDEKRNELDGECCCLREEDVYVMDGATGNVGLLSSSSSIATED